MNVVVSSNPSVVAAGVNKFNGLQGKWIYFKSNYNLQILFSTMHHAQDFNCRGGCDVIARSYRKSRKFN